MAVSVRIEDEAFSDRRYDVMATMLGLPDADCARGKMAAIWRQCTQQQTHVLSAELVCAVLGPNGCDALVKSELGAAVKGGIRIRGTQGRIEWLARLRKNGAKGGRPRKPNGNHLVIENTRSEKPGVNPPAPAPAPAPAPTIREEKGRVAAPLELAPPPAPKPPREPKIPKPAHPDRARVIDAFHQQYKIAYGTKPTWDSTTVAQVETLLKKHSCDVLIARIDFMFAGRSKWPPPPYTLGSFVANIDRWVDDGAAKTGRVEPKTPSEYPDGDMPI